MAFVLLLHEPSSYLVFSAKTADCSSNNAFISLNIAETITWDVESGTLIDVFESPANDVEVHVWQSSGNGLTWRTLAVGDFRYRCSPGDGTGVMTVRGL